MADNDRFAGMGSGGSQFSRVPYVEGDGGGLSPQLKKMLLIGVGTLAVLATLYVLVTGVTGLGRGSATTTTTSSSSRKSQDGDVDLKQAAELRRCRAELLECRSNQPQQAGANRGDDLATVKEQLKAAISERDEARADAAEVRKTAAGLSKELAEIKKRSDTPSGVGSADCSSVEAKLAVALKERDKLAAAAAAAQNAPVTSASTTVAVTSAVDTTTSTTARAVAPTPRPDAVTPSEELQACLKKTEALGEEVRTLEMRLNRTSKAVSSLSTLGQAVRAESGLIDKDTAKVMEAGVLASNPAVKEALDAVKTDLVQRSVELGKASSVIDATKEKVARKVEAVRESASTLKGEIVRPLGSPRGEQLHLDEAKIRAAKEEKALAPSTAVETTTVADAASATPSPAAAADVLKADGVATAKEAVPSKESSEVAEKKEPTLVRQSKKQREQGKAKFEKEAAVSGGNPLPDAPKRRKQSKRAKARDVPVAAVGDAVSAPSVEIESVSSKARAVVARPPPPGDIV